MIYHFSLFLVVTGEGENETKEVAKIVTDYLLHAKQREKHKMGADCDKEVIDAAKTAKKVLKAKYGVKGAGGSGGGKRDKKKK